MISPPKTSASVAVPGVASRARRCMICPAEHGAVSPVVLTRLTAFAVPEAVDTDGAHNAVNAGSSVDPAEMQTASTAHVAVPDAVLVVHSKLMSIVTEVFVSDGIR